MSLSDFPVNTSEGRTEVARNLGMSIGATESASPQKTKQGMSNCLRARYQRLSNLFLIKQHPRLGSETQKQITYHLDKTRFCGSTLIRLDNASEKKVPLDLAQSERG